jgi:predicted secreted acid phosphatase
MSSISPPYSPFQAPLLFFQKRQMLSSNQSLLQNSSQIGDSFIKFSGESSDTESKGTEAAKKRAQKAYIQASYQPEFQTEFQHVLDRAKAQIEKQQTGTNKGITLLDIDETVLDNRGFYFESPLPKAEDAWSWFDKGAAPAIQLGKEFVEWHESKNYPYVYLTARREKHRRATEQALCNGGLIGPNCLGIYFRPNDSGASRASHGPFKEVYRKQIEEKHGPIIACIGDQPSDMTGKAEKDFLLPSATYPWDKPA